jgi:hypothetical protein
MKSFYMVHYIYETDHAFYSDNSGQHRRKNKIHKLTRIKLGGKVV